MTAITTVRYAAAIAIAAGSAAGLSLAAQSTPRGERTVSAAEPLTITVLSSRPDMVTGGDAVLRITGGTSSSGPYSVTVNGRAAELMAARRAERGGAYQGVVSGLTVGKNTVTVKSAEHSASIELTNYPVTGPVFSGAHRKPFLCQT